ncbi:MAG: ribonuclease P protein component [Ruminococcus sp.]
MLYTEILNNNRDFLALYRKGKFTASKNIVIYVRKNNLPFNRLGITAGKKIGNAVHRNRAKRIIRQAYRENELAMPLGIDIVIVARSSVCSAKSTELSGYLKKYGIPEINRLLFGLS